MLLGIPTSPLPTDSQNLHHLSALALIKFSSFLPSIPSPPAAPNFSLISSLNLFKPGLHPLVQPTKTSSEQLALLIYPPMPSSQRATPSLPTLILLSSTSRAAPASRGTGPATPSSQKLFQASVPAPAGVSLSTGNHNPRQILAGNSTAPFTACCILLKLPVIQEKPQRSHSSCCC